MIETLQKKFVVTAMTAITILLIVLLGVINIANAFVTSGQTDLMLDSLLKNEISPIPQLPPVRGEKRDFPDSRFPENNEMSAVFFSVYVSDGRISGVDTGRIGSMSEEDALLIAEKALSSMSAEGKTGNYKYKSASLNDGRTVYIFLDTSIQTQSVTLVLVLSCLVGALCVLMMLLPVRFLAKKSIRPIAENIERQKRFITDAGHELKTPLAIILANTDAMELMGGENKYSKNIREQILRLTGLMQNLLTLAKIDENEAHIIKETVDIGKTADETLDMFREAMLPKNLSLEKHIQSDVFVSANKELLSQLFSVLTDNAVKYATDGSTIYTELYRADKNAVFAIRNKCESLPDCPPEKLFDRFYRADSARTQKSGGYGIGLSSATAIANAHGGTLSANYADNNTIIFTVKLPV